MDYLYAVIFGIVQGVTEFLPISSSGHLIVLHNFINLPIENELTFDVFLHLASLLSVLLYFRKDIIVLLKAWFLSFGGKKSDESKIFWLIIIATIPAALIGFLFDDFVEKIFHEGIFANLAVATMLIIVGILFLYVEKISRKGNSYLELNAGKALIIGFSQVLALIPGTSRSGITIISGLFCGLKREEAIKFSFLLSIPIILGASIKEAPQIFINGAEKGAFGILIVGFLFSFLFGLLSIKYLLAFSRNHKLNIFAYYRFLLAAIIILLFLV